MALIYNQGKDKIMSNEINYNCIYILFIYSLIIKFVSESQLPWKQVNATI